MKDYVLGIDTSNYKTSVAVVCRDGQILHDLRKSLKVKQGGIGLRQSYALFQHIEVLPGMIQDAIDTCSEKIGAVAVAVKPRPVESSYMPVFKAGENFAATIAGTLKVPIFKFAHQEGHIEAVKYYSRIKDRKKFLCYHLSGGTCELLRIEDDDVKIIGGSKDISFGQLIDRVGVKMGIDFPCGKKFDKITLETEDRSNLLKEVPIKGLQVNLSGMETQASKIVLKGIDENQKNMLVKEIFSLIGNALINLTEKAVAETNISDVLFTGGVSSSAFLHDTLRARFDGTNINVDFGNQKLAPDNAVGIALLGGRQLWR